MLLTNLVHQDFGNYTNICLADVVNILYGNGKRNTNEVKSGSTKPKFKLFKTYEPNTCEIYSTVLGICRIESEVKAGPPQDVFTGMRFL